MVHWKIHCLEKDLKVPEFEFIIKGAKNVPITPMCGI